MEKSEKMKVTNAGQFEKLVEELEKNPTLAVGFRRGTVPSNFKEQWEEIAKILNALGPPRRLADGWQKVWRDLKFKVKKKMISNKAECNATGGGIFKQFTFSPLEENVANLLNFQKHLNPEGTVQGVQVVEMGNDFNDIELAFNPEVDLVVGQSTERIHQSNENLAEDVSGYNKDVRSVMMKTANIPKNKDKNSELLQKHSQEQAKLLSDISNSISSIKRTLRDADKRQKQLLDIEQKKN